MISSTTAWIEATESGALPAVEADARPDIEIERPANPEHGDVAANLAMKTGAADAALADADRGGPRRRDAHGAWP